MGICLKCYQNHDHSCGSTKPSLITVPWLPRGSHITLVNRKKEGTVQKRGVICWTRSTCSDRAIPFFLLITHLHMEEVRYSLQLPNCHSQSAGKQLEFSISLHISPCEKLINDGDDDDDDCLTEQMRVNSHF